MSDAAEVFRESDPRRELPELSRLAAEHADDVDARARFPTETITAARKAGLLSAGFVPGSQTPCDIRLQTEICFELAQSCASSAMILAMHYIQLDSIAAHQSGNEKVSAYLSQLANEQRLIASATSEVGVDGDLRKSIAALETTAGGFELTKQATTISYGQYADDFLITARANLDAPGSDQRLILALGPDTRLDTAGSWDTLGMRGTVSPGGTVTASGEAWQILDTPFSEIAAISMVPLSHLLWSACWLGNAKSAVDRARKAVQKKARKDPESVRMTAAHLTNLHAEYQQLRAQHETALTRYTELVGGPDQQQLTSMKEAIRFNDLKLDVSEGIVQIVQKALQVVGISAYRNDAEQSLGRHLRDALSASLMINNDRIRAANADMQLLYKGN